MKLMEHLQDCDKDDLKKIGEQLGLTLPLNENAQKWRERVAETLSKPEVVEARLCTLTDRQIALFERACDEMFVPERDELDDSFTVEDTLCAFAYEKPGGREPVDFKALLKEGKTNLDEASRKFAEAIQKLAELYVAVPDEIAALYRDINTPAFQRRRHVSSWLAVCVNVSGKLYAVTPVPILTRMYALKEAVEEEEVRRTLSLLPRMGDKWTYDKAGDRVICPPMEEAEVQEILDLQGDRDFRIPPLEEMENLDCGYYPFTLSGYQNFRQFLTQYCFMDNWDADNMVEELWSNLLKENDVEGDLQWLIDCTNADPKIMKLVMTLYKNCMKETPCVAYRGYTRADVGPSVEELAFQDREFNLEFDMEAPKVRIGRNEPCPCGSGKKYKKCCGR